VTKGTPRTAHRTNPAAPGTTIAAGKGGEAEQGRKAPQRRAQAYEEFASRIGDHEIVEGVLTKYPSPADTKPITFVVDDATLACLEHDWRVKEAVEKTGHPFRDILKNCQLVLGGQPDSPSTWPIRWPCGFIPEEHGQRIRAVLFLVWAFSADDLGDDDLTHRHDRAVDWMAHYQAGVDLTAARTRQAAEHRRRQEGGKGRTKVREHNVEEVKRLWPLCPYHTERRKIEWVARRAKPKKVCDRTVRRIASELGFLKK